MFIPSKRTLAVTTAVFAIAGSGAAFAYWTTTGTGSGTANTGTTAALAFVQPSNANGLVPGGSVTVPVDVTNPGSAPVNITAITASIASFSVQPNTGKPACTQSDFTVSNPTFTGELAAGATTNQSVVVTMVNSTTSNQDNCKNISVPINYSAS